jgi:AmmeMemoRadiSam system protein B
VLLRDPQQVAAQALLVPQALTPLLALCDGTHGVSQLATAFRRRTGLPIDLQQVEEVLQMLDHALMLDNDRYRAALAKMLANYQTAPCRPPALAGHAYPQEAPALWQQLQNYLEAAESIAPLAVDWSHPLGMLSPHIDYQRGGAVYGQVWKRMAQAAREAELVIIFGTDHYGSDPFTLTRQHYATPYGILPTDQPIVDALATVMGEEAAFVGELRHRTEHSLELVAVWLHHMRAGAPCAVVPILCGGFHRFWYNGHQPQHDQLLHRVIATVQQLSAGRRVLIVASGDLAHVGPAFGGKALTDPQRAALRQADEQLLARMAAGDAEGFFAAIHQVRDANNVCGVAPIYLTMRATAATTGEPVGYATCPADEFDTSVVTVGGMVFRGSA